jgi:hypothetical protein
MLRSDFHVIIAPAKEVEYSDQELERAQALFDEYRAVMNPDDRILAQSLLD